MELYREFYAVINALNKNGLATREDLVWMKSIRGSKQDEAEIEKLEGSE